MWLLRHALMTDRVSEVQAAWQLRWNGLEREHLQIAKELQEALRRASLVPGLETELAKLQTNYQTLSDRHVALDADWKRKCDTLEKDWRGKVTTIEKERTDLQRQLQAQVQERDTLKVNLNECGRQRTALEEEGVTAQAQLADWARRFAALEHDVSNAKAHVVTLTSERDRLQQETRTVTEQSQAAEGTFRQRVTTFEQECEQLKTQLAKATASESEWRGKWQESEGKHSGAQQQIAGLMTRVEAMTTLEAKYKAAEERLGGDIERIEGIGPAFGQRLRAAGIAWVVDLLDQCCTPEGRTQVAEKTNFTPQQLLTWANMADLLRLPGMTPDWAELLHAAGVETVKELKQRVPENLQKKMAEVNAAAERRISPAVPDETTVQGWVEQARTMEYRITH